MFTPPEDRLAETLKQQASSIRDVQRGTGTEKNRTLEQLFKAVTYLTTLNTYAASGASWNTGTIPNDQVTRWADGTLVEIAGIDIPYGKVLVTASVGESSVAPASGGWISGMVSFRIFDANGTATDTDVEVKNRAGRLYGAERMGVTISTTPQVMVIDRNAHPGPYKIRLQYGYWASIAGTGDPSINFNAPSLTVQIIGDGVPD
ncbi:hypothetical protein ACIPY5_12060 [Microbacterium sp. NPDC089698]|uniref:hypothetical protein n=1 Tax=Microbacterium sp. NPDC089698 TaxID=3364200 RepID=UPI00382006DD